MEHNKAENINKAAKYIPIEMSKEEVETKFPVENEPRITTMDRPLIIESACPGFQIGGARYPAVPISIKDQIKEQVESVKAGAAIIHVHARDPETGLAQMNHELLARVLDGIFDKVGDCITFTHSWYPVPNADIDCKIGTEELLKLGKGNKYVQGSLMVPIGHHIRGTTSWIGATGTVEGIKWLQERHVKPVYQLYDTFSHLVFKRYLFDTAIDISKPYIMNLQLGKHDAHAINHDPWSYIQFITSMNMIKENVMDSLIGVYPGGRNWIPMVALGMLAGADIFRVGIEDLYWMYPHKDEIIKKHSDIVKWTVELANMFGRRVVTSVKEAREILNIKLTSKL